MLNTTCSAAWSGARIIFRQVSPESLDIFDFILELHRTCSGDWPSLIGSGVSSEDLHRFLTYAATFLSNVGNYYVCCVVQISVIEAILISLVGFRRSEIHSRCGQKRPSEAV
jgi:hypothetical protein